MPRRAASLALVSTIYLHLRLEADGADSASSRFHQPPFLEKGGAIHILSLVQYRDGKSLDMDDLMPSP